MKWIKNTFIFLLILIVITSGLIASYRTLDHAEYLRSLKGNPVRIEQVSATHVQNDSLVEYRITTDKNSTIQFALRKPVQGNEKYPVIIILGGLEIGKKSLQYLPGAGGNILVALDYPYQPKYWYRKKDFYRDLWIIRTALIRMVPNTLQVIDYLYRREDVDTRRVNLTGYSFGAPFIPVMMKLDRRLSSAIIAYGGGNIGGMLADNLKTGYRWTDRLLGYTLGLLLAEIEPLRYLDAISPRPVLFINGYNDTLIRPERARLLHQRALDPKEIIWLETRHMNPRTPEVTRQIISTSVTWMQNKGLIR